MTKKEILKQSYPKYKIIEVEIPKRSGKLLSGEIKIGKFHIKYWTDPLKKIIYFL